MRKISTILIVDDDTDDQELLKEAIHDVDESVSCLSAWNGEEALQLLQTPGAPRPDLIFLDLNMPRMNGKTFLTHLKKLNALCLIPVVIYTTSKAEEDVAETRLLGAERFFTKPDSFEGIVQIVTGMLPGEKRVVAARDGVVE